MGMQMLTLYVGKVFIGRDVNDDENDPPLKKHLRKEETVAKPLYVGKMFYGRGRNQSNYE